MIYVRVVVNIASISGEYDYHLPPDLESIVSLGHLVSVPFGNKVVQGVVLERISQPGVSQTKAVIELIDPSPVLTPEQLAFARILAEQTLNTLAAAVDLMLPVGLSQHADTVYSLQEKYQSDPNAVKELKLSMIPGRIVDLLLARGSLRGRQIDRHFQRVEWRRSAQNLLRQGILISRSILPPPSVRPKYILTAQLAVSPQDAELAMPVLGKTAATLERRQKALRFLVNEPDAVTVNWVYAESGCNLTDLQELAEKELIVLLECEIFRDPLRKFDSLDQGNTESKKGFFQLTPAQESALKAIFSAFNDRKSSAGHIAEPFLLYGVTGSGKTEIYLRSAAEAIRLGKSVIIMVPEIAITPQVVRRFLTHFPGQVGLIHSKLTDGERYDTWRRARSGQLKIIIGPRSALFSPLPSLGLIVVDECHDNSYFQSDPPFYNAVNAAEIYARAAGAVCIFGSATPSVEMHSRSLEGSSKRSGHGLVNLELLQRFQTSGDSGTLGELPPVSIVDMREELKAGNRAIFSRQLLEALAETLQRKEQAILYLNRRGTATYVFCRECGHTVKCPSCDTPLTYHTSLPNRSIAKTSSQNALICHRCGYRRQMPAVCPECKGTQIRAYGLGSEKVETDIKELFPEARVLRWDWETTREKDAHDMIMMHFVNHQADILVGTQMLAKGLDLPLVTLVGIVLADFGLSYPDPYASERAFQLLTQVSGRAGRSFRGGRVILQTFIPENPVIQLASKHDYESFYHWELDNRRMLGYPPYSRLIRLEYRHENEEIVKTECTDLFEKIKNLIEQYHRTETSIIGPVPCFFPRDNGVYRWQIIVRGPDPISLLRNRIPAGWRVEVDPVNLL